jgi:hypothetical protein
MTAQPNGAPMSFLFSTPKNNNRFHRIVIFAVLKRKISKKLTSHAQEVVILKVVKVVGTQRDRMNTGFFYSKYDFLYP